MLTRKHALLWCEMLLLYGTLPVLVIFTHSRWVMFGLMWLGIPLFLLYLKKARKLTYKKEWNTKAATRKHIKAIGIRFLICAAFLIPFAYILRPEHFFAFPRERFSFWAL